MLDFSPIFKQEQTMAQLCSDLSPEKLGALTDEMIDAMLAAIQSCSDEMITFVYTDPALGDDDEQEAWTLSKVITHTTAGAEEAAFVAAELARGVQRDGRSLSEADWKKIDTVEQCVQRLEESRHMRLATLDVWPDEPHLDLTVEVGFLPGPFNPVAYFALGLLHDSMHLEQIEEIKRQAKAAHP